MKIKYRLEREIYSCSFPCWEEQNKGWLPHLFYRSYQGTETLYQGALSGAWVLLSRCIRVLTEQWGPSHYTRSKEGKRNQTITWWQKSKVCWICNEECSKEEVHLDIVIGIKYLKGKRGKYGCENLGFVFMELTGLQERLVLFTEDGLLLNLQSYRQRHQCIYQHQENSIE